MEVSTGLSAMARSLVRAMVPRSARRRLLHLAATLTALPAVRRRWERYLRDPRSRLSARTESLPGLSFREFRFLVTDGWYHDFSALGVRTAPLHPNQRCKQAVLLPMIERAIGICRRTAPVVTGVELFCADGYYAHCALQRGASYFLGIDRDGCSIIQARVISGILGHTAKARFVRSDVFRLKGEFDLCICAGGLYHLADPAKLLRLLRSRVRRALVIQTVYSLAEDAGDYFESPAPGWSWGCRFSYRYLLEMVRGAGWTVESGETNELEGNRRPEDRGSAYLLCLPGRGQASSS